MACFLLVIHEQKNRGNTWKSDAQLNNTMVFFFSTSYHLAVSVCVYEEIAKINRVLLFFYVCFSFFFFIFFNSRHFQSISNDSRFSIY